MFLFKKYKTAPISLIIVLLFLILPALALSADSTGLNTTAKTGFGEEITSEGNSNLPLIIGKIVGAALAFLGVIFFCLMLYAGLSWILSMGKEEKITQAKDMIIAAVLGLMVVLGAYAITNLLTKIFTEAIPR